MSGNVVMMVMMVTLADSIRIVAVTLTLLAVPVGCSSDSSSDETDGSTTDSTQGTSEATEGSTSGSAECDRCVAAAPDGWTGPVAVYRGQAGNDPSCAGEYAEDAGTYGINFDAGEATCQCVCSVATGIMCTGSIDVCYSDGPDLCNAACDTPDLTLNANSCEASGVSGNYGRATAPAPDDAGSCAPSEAHIIDTPTFGTSFVACGRADASETGCSDTEVCAPQAEDPFDQLCIFQSGDVECPGETFTERTLVYGGVEDTRACSGECSCGAADSTCGGSVQFSNSNACDNAMSTVPAGACSMNFGEPFAQYVPEPSGTCVPSASSLSGEATAAQPTTLCCL